MKKSMKRFFAVVLTVALCFTVMPMAFAAGVRGDVNKDGKTNSADALLILRKSVGYKDNDCDAYRADLNNDGAVNATDALRVLQMAVGSDNPTGYSKNEVIKFYSDAFDSIAMSKMTVSYETKYQSKMVNDNDRNDFVEFNETDDFSVKFENGNSNIGDTISEFCPETRIDPSLVKSAKITKKDASTYVVNIVLVADSATDEKCVPPKTYKYLLNYADCTASGFEDYYVDDATASFPASEITAVVKDGCLKELTLDIPFEMHMKLKNYNYNEYFNVTETGHVIDTYVFAM